MDDLNRPRPEAPDDNKDNKLDAAESISQQPLKYKHQPYESKAEPQIAYQHPAEGQQGRVLPPNAVPGNMPRQNSNVNAYPPHQPYSAPNAPAGQGRFAPQAGGNYVPGAPRGAGPYPPNNFNNTQNFQQYPMQQMYGYPPQAGYPGNPYQAPVYWRAPRTGKATASLVLGIISLVFGWMSVMSFVGLPCAIVGLILGIIGRKELPPEHGRGTATAGMVCSIIGLVMAVLMIALSIWALAFLNFTTDFGPSFGV